MVELVAKTPFEGVLPVEIGTVQLREVAPGQLTLLSARKGKIRALGAVLKDHHGVNWPLPGRAQASGTTRIVWFGRGQAMLMGPEPHGDLSDVAACVDQSDGWGVARLDGAKVEAVLARQVPLDVRLDRFKAGHTARCQVFHIPVSLTRIGAETFEILVFRSMARSLVHDLKSAMEAVRARG